MAGTLVPSAAIEHLRPQRGEADASWPAVGGVEGEQTSCRHTQSHHAKSYKPKVMTRLWVVDSFPFFKSRKSWSFE